MISTIVAVPPLIPRCARDKLKHGQSLARVPFRSVSHIAAVKSAVVPVPPISLVRCSSPEASTFTMASSMRLAGAISPMCCSMSTADFSKASGFTLHEYQQQLRLRAALQLIAECNYNGAGIALQLGFANHSHFSDVFRARFGITPTQFAKLCSQASLEAMQDLLDSDGALARA